MDLASWIAGALLTWILFVPLLTFHEFAHAWTAWKCGDDLAHSQGRVSLNPIVHMEVIGSVVLPLATLLLGGFMFGWGRPVPVNLNNLSNPRVQDSMIAMAGPAMNLLIAALLLGLVKLGQMTGQTGLSEIAAKTAIFSLLLCFFNLIPVPPLDGSHILLHLTGMKYETYFQLAQFGFIIVILLVQFTPVGPLMMSAIEVTLTLFARMWGVRTLDI